MRKILTDLECPNCGAIIIDEFVDEDFKSQKCSECANGEMVRVIGYGSFKLVFNQKTDLCDWHGNRNRYWDAVKQAKAEGRKVKACNEN